MQSKTVGKSAGRVQSVALKLIVDREREIESFKEEEYWTVTAKFADMEASLDTVDGKKADLKTEEETDMVIDGLDSKCVISNYETKPKKKAIRKETRKILSYHNGKSTCSFCFRSRIR